MGLLTSLADRWVSRSASPAPEALAAVAGLEPATVITGASEGLGFALASRITREGRVVVLVARRVEPLEDAVSRLRAAHPNGRIIAASLDVGRLDAFEQLEDLLASRDLYLDVLVNNAGIALTGPFSVQDPATLDELVVTNVGALTRLTRLALAPMRARGRGGIMNISSLGSFTPGPWNAAYFASKAYVLSLTAALAAECAGEGVRVCAVAFGPVRTEMLDKFGGSRSHFKSIFAGALPERMARLAWRSYRLGRRVVTPGFTTYVLAWWVRAMPYEILLPLMRWVMKPRVDATEDS
jgi:short-subunit dehydrogenase